MIEQEKLQFRQQLQDLKESNISLQQDDGYMDDILEFEQEQWNNINMKDNMVASLSKQQRSGKKPSRFSKTANGFRKKKKKNYNFERIKKGISKQNYKKTAKNFNKGLRLDLEELNDLKKMNNVFNPYPYLNEPMVNREVRFLTADDPNLNPSSPTSFSNGTLTSYKGGRFKGGMPKIDGTKSLKNTGRPNFKVRRPLSGAYSSGKNSKKNMRRTMSRFRSDKGFKNRMRKRGRKFMKPTKIVGFDEYSKPVRFKKKKRSSRKVIYFYY